MKKLYEEVGISDSKRRLDTSQLSGRIDAAIEVMVEHTRQVEGSQAVRNLFNPGSNIEGVQVHPTFFFACVRKNNLHCKVSSLLMYKRVSVRDYT